MISLHSQYKFLLTATIALLLTASAAAQSSGSNSSYSRFGVGLVSDYSQGFNKAMGGVAQGMRGGTIANALNPASYSAIDSLSFIFDVGMSLHRTRMTQLGEKQAFNNTTFDYVSAGFRLRPRLGMSIGFQPVTNIGYSFSLDYDVLNDLYSTQLVSQTLSYAGSGGLHNAFIGVGWEPLKGFSIGANIGYLWGNVDHQAYQAFAEGGTVNSTSYGSLLTTYTASLKSWKADIGVQYQAVLNKKSRLTLGATVGIGHTLGGTASLLRTTANGDTIYGEVDKAYEIPMTYSAGFAWEHDNKLTIAADFSFEQWEKCKTPQIVNGKGTISYVARKGAYTNRTRINIGAEYTPERYSNNYWNNIRYRFGAVYSTPYLIVNDENGPKEFGLSAGVGLPILNKINSRSMVNVGFHWTRRVPSVSYQVTENIISISVGLTFNERWFMKWKFK